MVISTPHTAHLPNVLAAAAAGKHILLEKPMALSVEECTAMNEACEAAGVKLSLAKISRWLEAVKVGHDLVADGTAGELVALHVHRLFPGYPNTGWPLDPRGGRGVARLGQPRLRHRALVRRSRADRTSPPGSPRAGRTCRT